MFKRAWEDYLKTKKKTYFYKFDFYLYRNEEHCLQLMRM